MPTPNKEISQQDISARAGATIGDKQIFESYEYWKEIKDERDLKEETNS